MTNNQQITLFLCGDVMTGRGIDQILPHPSHPKIQEPYVKDAREYVELAEQKNGKIAMPASFSYIWGAALREFADRKPDAKIINLETAITKSEDWAPKGINYRMHPGNADCLAQAKIDCCVLGNNHILDFGHSGLFETLGCLSRIGIKSAGAGQNHIEAETPAILEIERKGRVLVFSCGMETSGIPRAWAATSNRPGIHFLEDLSINSVYIIADLVRRFKRPNDIALLSIHWGGNWGYEIDEEEVRFAHALIDEAAVNIVHGHSSHHPKGIEVYRDSPIIYGCGDFITDYEGIAAHEKYRGDLGLMYFATVNPSSGDLVRLEMVPAQVKRLRVNHATRQDALWLKELFIREGLRFGTSVEMGDDGLLTLRWNRPCVGL